MTSRKTYISLSPFSCLKELVRFSNTPGNTGDNNEHSLISSDLNVIASSFSIKYGKNNVIFSLWPINVVSYIDRFSIVGPSLYFWDNSYASYYLVRTLLDLSIYYFV